MLRKLAILLLCLIPSVAFTQEFYCMVQVSAPQVEGTERKVFQTMQQAIYEFINNRKWTNLSFRQNEKIECSIMITISERVSSDQFKGKLNIVLQRPVFKTSYLSPVLNYVDKDFDFKYVEYEPLIYTENAFTSNLTSVLAFYLNTMLGFDADSFTRLGGTPYFEKAKAIVNTAQNAQEKGWKGFENMRNRFWLIENLLNGAYTPIREGIYQYHRLGFDLMSDNLELGRSGVTASMENFLKAYREKPGLFLLQIIMDAKRDEVANLYSQASPMDKARVLEILKEIDPANSNKYQQVINSKN
jgi:hypothetical protein